MKHKKSFLFTATVIALSVITFTACQIKLDPAGAYHGNKLLWSADSTIDTTRIALQSFVSWEKTNETFLMTNAPAITRAADLVREKAPGWLQAAVRARNSYEDSITSVTATPTEVAQSSNNLQQAITSLKIDAANADKQKTLVSIPGQ